MPRISRRQLLLTIFLPAAVLVGVAVAKIYLHVPLDQMTRDPASIAGIHPFAGILSSLGVLLWSSAAAVCLFSSVVVRAQPRSSGARFLLYSGLVTVGLLLDDFFLFHDFLAPQQLGLREKFVYALWIGAALAYLYAFRRDILQTEYTVLGLALVFFTISVAADVVGQRWLTQLGDWENLLEDGMKFLGVSAWCSYYVRTSYQLVLGDLKLEDSDR
jgi:hypothetical protein